MAIKFVPVTGIREIESGEVYDITNLAPDKLDGTGHFIIDGAIVHNCIPDYVKRRDSDESQWRAEEHPKVAALLEKTYGILVYQEDLAAVWQAVAGFTATEAQDARKAVAKKWKEKLKPIEQKWIDGATPVIGREWAETYWQRMVSFGRYAFNKCVSVSTVLKDEDTGELITVGQAVSDGKRLSLKSYADGKAVNDQVVAFHYTGEQPVYRVEFDDGGYELVTMQHKFLCADGKYHELQEILHFGLELASIPADRSDDEAEAEGESLSGV